MKYLLFGGADHYPHGGIGDLIHKSDSLPKLLSYLNSLDRQTIDWWHIYNMTTTKIIAASDNYEPHDQHTLFYEYYDDKWWLIIPEALNC